MILLYQIKRDKRDKFHPPKKFLLKSRKSQPLKKRKPLKLKCTPEERRLNSRSK